MKWIKKVQKLISGDNEYHPREFEPKPYRRENPGSSVSLNVPVEIEDLKSKLLQALPLYGFAEQDSIYLIYSLKNGHLYFNNYTGGDGISPLVGKYVYFELINDDSKIVEVANIVSKLNDEVT